MTRDIIYTLAALATMEAAGWLISGLFNFKSPVERLAVSFGLGMGAITLGLMVVDRLGLPLNGLTVYLLTAVIWGALIIRAGHKRPPVAVSVSRTSLTLQAKLLALFLALFIIVGAGNILYRAVSRPLSAGDDRVIWAAEAKIIYYEKSLKAAGLTDKYRLHPHKDYPLLVPLNEFFVFAFNGRVVERWVKLIFVALFFSLLIVFYYYIAADLGVVAGLAAVLIVAALPAYSSFSFGAPTGYADTPLAFYYVSAVIYALRWLSKRRPDYLFLSFILAATAALTKNEGLGLALILILLTVIFSLRSSWDLKWLAAAGASAALIIIFWLSAKKIYPVSWENYIARFKLTYIKSGWGRLSQIMTSWSREFLEPIKWGRVYPIALISLIAAPMSLVKKENLFIVLNLIGALLMYTIIYLVTPWTLSALLKVSMSRLLLPLTPLVVLFIFAQLKART